MRMNNRKYTIERDLHCCSFGIITCPAVDDLVIAVFVVVGFHYSLHLVLQR